MRKSKTIQIDGRDILVKELTVADVDKILTASEQKRLPHPAELLLDPAIPVEAVTLATGMTSEELSGDIAPSELSEIWEAVAEVNDFLSKLMVRLAAAGEAMVMEKRLEDPSAG